MAERGPGAATEEPTPRRLAEARRQGQMAVSPALSSAVALVAALAALGLGGAAGAGQLVTSLRGTLAAAPRGGAPGPALSAGLGQGVALLAMPLGLVVVAIVVTGLAQTGGLFTLTPLRPRMRRPGRGPSAQALAELGWGALRTLVLAGVAWLALAPLARAVAGLTGASAGRVLAAVGQVGLGVGLKLAAASLLLGVVDRLWRQQRHRRALRMTRDEVERERRQHEGDPRHKAERQRLQREPPGYHLELRPSDFVVSGPALSIALRYEPAGPRAPVVVARGERREADRIVALARDTGALVVEDPGLADALRGVAEGEQIPGALFEPIAKIVQVVLEERNR